jgi:hypothetical protein
VIGNKQPVPQRTVKEGVRRIVKRRRPVPQLPPSPAAAKREQTPPYPPRAKPPQTPSPPPSTVTRQTLSSPHFAFSPYSPPLPPLPFRNPTLNVPSRRVLTPPMPTARDPINIHDTCRSISSYKTCTLCFEAHAHPHNSPSRATSIINMGGLCVEGTDVQQAAALIENAPVFQPLAKEMSAPPGSEISLALPKKTKKQKNKNLYIASGLLANQIIKWC